MHGLLSQYLCNARLHSDTSQAMSGIIPRIFTIFLPSGLISSPFTLTNTYISNLDSMKLIVLNLPRNFSENQLAKLFKTYGNIKECSLVLDTKTGTSKGFGFVTMALEHEGVAVVKKLDGSTIQQNKIRVKVAS